MRRLWWIALTLSPALFASAAADQESHAVFFGALVRCAEADIRQPIRGKTEVVCVRDWMAIDRTDFVSARTSLDALRGEPRVTLVFSGRTAQQMSELLNRSFFAPLAIRLRSEIVLAPVIRDIIIGDKIQVSAALSRGSRADALAEEIAKAVTSD